MLGSKSGSDLAGILAFRTGYFSPVSWLFFSCLEDFLNLEIPIHVRTVCHFNSVNLGPESVITPIAAVTSSSSVPSLPTLTVPQWFDPLWLPECDFTNKVLTGILVDILSLYKVRKGSIASGVFSILCDIGSMNHDDKEDETP